MNAFKKTCWSFFMMAPVLVSVVLLIALLQTIIDNDSLLALFRGNIFADSFVGAIIGSIAPGNPITSYVLGGEMLSIGVSLTAVIAFLVAWVTVGVVQFPAEALMLGKRFSIFRNLFSFLSAIFIGILTGFIVGIL